MKKLLALALLAVSGSAWSATVTIDFESLTPGDIGAPDIEGDRYFETDGFSFYINGFLADTGTNQYVTGFGPDGVFAPPGHILMSRTDGQAFSLMSADVFDCNEFCNIFGVVAGGGAVTTMDAADLGSGDWLNVTYVEFYNSSSAPFQSVISVDNLMVGSPVPVPAAVWLFGSALAGLGWMRRKRVT